MPFVLQYVWGVTYRRTTTITLRVVETIERDDDFADEPPSLSGIPVYDTTAEPIAERGPGLAKCGAAGAERGRKAGGR